MFYTNETYLAHYGVLGMKWGVRRYQPYPSGKKGRFIGKTPTKKTSSSTEETEKKPWLTDKQKKYIKIGAAVAATALVAYGGYKVAKHYGKSTGIDSLPNLNRSTGIDSLLDLNKTPEIDSLTGFNKKKFDVLNLKTLNEINTGYLSMSKGDTMNCGNCTVAFEMRRRGLDVIAKRNPTGMSFEHMGQYFEGFTKDNIKRLSLPDNKLFAHSEIIKQLDSSYPAGASGNMTLTMNGGFNHFVSWIKTNQGVRIIDPQNPNYDLSQLFVNLTESTSAGKRHGVSVIRLDNLKVKNSIKELVQSTSGLTDSIHDNFKANILRGEGFVIQNWR